MAVGRSTCGFPDRPADQRSIDEKNGTRRGIGKTVADREGGPAAEVLKELKAANAQLEQREGGFDKIKANDELKIPAGWKPSGASARNAHAAGAAPVRLETTQ